MSESITAEEFGMRLEGYFGKKYTPVQQQEVKRWADRRSPRVRFLIYRLVVERETWLPLIAKLNEIALEVAEGYPELDMARAPEGTKQITDDAGWTEEELDEALDRFRAIAGRVADAKNIKASGKAG